MKKFIFILCMFFGLISCHSTKDVVIMTGNTLGMSMMNSYEKDFSKAQFDSICKADKIPNNLGKWYQASYKDGETNKVIVEYLFIKELGQSEKIYRLVPISENSFKITKRITVK